jgi:hypothetical protein
MLYFWLAQFRRKISSTKLTYKHLSNSIVIILCHVLEMYEIIMDFIKK